MSTKKLLTYEGLEEYNIKWHERLQAMMIGDEELDEIWNELFPKFKITIDTEAVTAGAKKTGIPFNLYGQDGITLTVDWGDGTASTLTSADYSDAIQTPASVHEYATAGEYTVTVVSNDWENTYCYVAANDSNSDDLNGGTRYFQETLISVNEILPQIKGTIISPAQMFIWLTTGGIPTEIINDYTNDIFNNIPVAIDGLISCFANCINLQYISKYLFYNNKQAYYIFYCFSGCTSLTSIPSGLFDKNTAIVDFTGCFSGCTSLQSIPSGLFDKNTAVTDFDYCFGECTSFTSIPSGLFDKNTAATDFNTIFYHCTSLTSIPSGLFDKNMAATTFYGCFYGCSSLQSIPSGLFDNNTAVTAFNSCFKDCTSLQSIPSGLFDNNTVVTNFSYCFQNCSSLQSIPPGLFDNNTAVTSFYYCFSGCSSLQSIPEGLFDKNTAVTSFVYCFQNCSALNDFTLYIGSSSVSGCSYFVTSKANTTRTIYVPANSTTKTNFDAIASSLGLTILTYTPA